MDKEEEEEEKEEKKLEELLDEKIKPIEWIQQLYVAIQAQSEAIKLLNSHVGELFKQVQEIQIALIEKGIMVPDSIISAKTPHLH